MALRASIGQYHSTDSPIHRLDPRVKLVCTAIFMVSCFFVHNAATLAVSAVTIGIVAACSHVPVRRMLAQIRPIALFLVVTSFINLFFVKTGPLVTSLGPVQIHANGISAALLYTLRFFLLLLTGSLLTLTTTPTALADAAENVLRPLERIGVPVRQGALVLSIALRFVPTLAQEADNIVAAQTARGADLEGKGAIAYARACVPLIVPLFASALRHADNLGCAMDARCYTGGADRTHYHVMRIEPVRDFPIVFGLVIYLAILFVL